MSGERESQKGKGRKRQALPVGAESDFVKCDSARRVVKKRQPTKRLHGIKARNQAAFLRAYVRIGTVFGAAKAAGIHRNDHYTWLAEVPGYKERFLAADEDATQELERVALSRAKRISDTLTIFMLKAKRPAVYRERYEVSHGNTDDKPFKVYLVDTDPV